MKKREIKNGKKTEVIISEATDGVNKVRLVGSARAEEEEECPWEEIDAYSGRFVVAGTKYGSPGDSDNYQPWLAYSTDGGVTWIPSTTTSNTTSDTEQPHGNLQALAYGGGRFVVAGFSYYPDEDGGILPVELWFTYSTNSDNNNIHRQPWLAYSTDGGVTWLSSTTTSNTEQPHGYLHALAYGGGRFVVSGFRYGSVDDDSDNLHPWLAYSTDGGVTWTPSNTTSDNGQTHQTHGLLYALAYGGGRFVVAGFRYGINEGDSDNYHPWLAYSTDGGVTWTPSTTTSDTEQPHGLLYALAYGGGRFVAAGFRYEGSDDANNDYHPWLAYSTDGGVTWTPSTTTSDMEQTHGNLQALAYGGGRFVAAGYRYEGSGGSDNYHPWLAYSTDGGVTWTPSTTTSDMEQPHGLLYALAYGGGRFVVSGFRYEGSGGSDNYHPWIAYSTDGGVTWTPSTTTSNTEQTHGLLYALAYAPDSYCWKFGKEEKEKEEEEKEEE